jgi:two-component system, sensor histidine kinase and response regulator
MTAHATTEERQRCLAAGMNDHIAKPIDPDRLIETVAHFYDAATSVAPADPVDGTAQHQRPPEPDANLPSIDGLDARDGLSRVGGNRRLYVKLLREFIEQQGPAVAQASEALAAGDILRAERLAHSLKGVAGNLGAIRVQSLAARLEKAIRDRATAADVDAARQQAAEALGGLVTELRAALGPVASDVLQRSGTTTSTDPARSLEAAARLTTLLAEFDPAAADFLEANYAALRPLFGNGTWVQFEKLVQAYAFSEAQVELEHALKSFST